MASTPTHKPLTIAQKIERERRIFNEFQPTYSEIAVCGLFGSSGHGKSSLGNSLYDIVKTTVGSNVNAFQVGHGQNPQTMDWKSLTITRRSNNILKIFDNRGVGFLNLTTLQNVEAQIQGLYQEGQLVDWTNSRGFLDFLYDTLGWTKTYEPIHVGILVFSSECVGSIQHYAPLIEVLRTQSGVDPLVVITKKDLAHDSLESYALALHYDRDYIFMLQNYVSDEEYQEQQREEDNLVLWRLLNRILATAELSAQRRRDRGKNGFCAIL
eukprot:TRINITY_DN398_c0_g2_i1.p1 TRINITY_DN398_c0_g2~~TRINITY_DN398_c0_g2_i1.p1  ORF type:complete len:268 (-),score=20.47 TRINITY_DN398_c0_g2_i1:67-870(-)